jgi:hypothetical protein
MPSVKPAPAALVTLRNARRVIAACVVEPAYWIRLKFMVVL